MKMSRRAFIKAQAATSAAAVAGISLPAMATNLIVDQEKTKITWDKAPCRFCGTGCSVLVGTQAGRVVATQGDPKAPVNRGLNRINDNKVISEAVHFCEFNFHNLFYAEHDYLSFLYIV